MDNKEDKEFRELIVPMPMSALAWQMFTQTGMPGYYLLYTNLEHGEEHDILD